MNSQNRALIATRKGLFELERQNGEWRIGLSGFLGEPVSMMLHDRRDGSLYAALNLGHFGVKLHRRDRDSATWSEVAAPAYPQQPETVEGEPKDVDWKLIQIWSLEAGGKDEPGVLWAGTLPGGLFRSDDRGESWELVRSLWNAPARHEWLGGGYPVPGIHSICIDPRNSRHVSVGISCGGFWITHDAGQSWNVSTAGMKANYMPPERAEDPNIQDPHRIVQCSDHPDAFWCQHHGGIWRSINAGAQWEQIDPKLSGVSDFGFAVAVHPHDPATAWFVPAIADQRRIPVDAALYVSRTRDGGKTFEALRKGLPQKNCYDLVYRHGLDVSEDGQSLLMGSTTGGLWCSDNAGGHWQEISTTLPPIYAVRFF